MTDVDTVERVAKAIYAEQYPDCAADGWWEEMSVSGKDRYRSLARAAIAALPPAVPATALDPVAEAAKVLDSVPPETLRPILSKLANKTPDVVYWPTDFLSDFPDKKDDEGVSMSAHGQAALFLANACSKTVEPGGSVTFTLGGISHGAVNNGDWVVEVTRALTKDGEAG